MLKRKDLKQLLGVWEYHLREKNTYQAIGVVDAIMTYFVEHNFTPDLQSILFDLRSWRDFMLVKGFWSYEFRTEKEQLQAKIIKELEAL